MGIHREPTFAAATFDPPAGRLEFPPRPRLEPAAAMTARSPLLFAALLLPGAGPAEAPPAAGDWNQWRGPHRDGRVAFDLPGSLGEPALKESWRTTLGASYSGPVLGPDGRGGARVYTTESVGNTFETAKAFDAAAGDLLWEAKWEGSFSVPFFANPKTNG